jgi:hypothetical protein
VAPELAFACFESTVPVAFTSITKECDFFEAGES